MARLIAIAATGVAVLFWASVVGAGLVSPGPFLRVSLNSQEQAGDEVSINAAVSGDGRYVAFGSPSTNLVPDDTNSTYDIFVRDRLQGETTRVSVDSLGSQAACCLGANIADISADGRLITFESRASALVPGDTNGTSDIFVHDRQTGATERISIDTFGNQGDGPSFEAAISADGSSVAFYSRATNLVSGDTNGEGDIFVHDRLTAATERVSVDGKGNQANGESFQPRLSADGRFIAFKSRALNLVSGGASAPNVYVRDRLLGTTEIVSVDSLGNHSNLAATGHQDISADGRLVTFNSPASNLVPGDTNGEPDIFVHDRQTGVTERVSVHSAGSQANDESEWPKLSGDGRYVVFQSRATNLVDFETCGGGIYLHDRDTGTTIVEVSKCTAEGGSASAGQPSISEDGRFVTFHTGNRDLIAGDTNGATDVFILDHFPTVGGVAELPEPVGDLSSSPSSSSSLLAWLIAGAFAATFIAWYIRRRFT